MDSVGVIFLSYHLERSPPSHQVRRKRVKRWNRPFGNFLHNNSPHSSVPSLLPIWLKLPSVQEAWIKSSFQSPQALEIKISMSPTTVQLSSDQCTLTTPQPKSSSTSQRLKMNKLEMEQPLLQFWPDNCSEKAKDWFITKCTLKQSSQDGEWPEMQPKEDSTKSPETTLTTAKSSKPTCSTLPKPLSVQSYWPKTNNISPISPLRLFSDWRAQPTFLTSKSLRNSVAQSRILSSVTVSF